MGTAHRIVWYCLSALVFLVPIAMSNANWIPTLMPGLPGSQTFLLPLTYDQFDIVKVFVMRFFAIAGLIVWAFDFFMRGGKLRRTKLDLVVLVFLGWVLFTSLPGISISPATAFFGKYRRFEGFFSFLTYGITFFLVTQIVDRPSRIRSLARTLMFSALLVSGYGMLQYFGIDPVNWGVKLPFDTNRGFSTYGNPDLLGGFLVFPLPIALGMALSEKKVLWRVFYWVVFLLTVGAWITAFVRGSWIGGSVALIAVIVAAVLAKSRLGATDWSFIGITGAAAAAFTIRSMTSANPVLNVIERVKSIFQFSEGSALTRFEIWQAAWDAIKVRPITGFGADTFRLIFPQYKPAAYTRDAGYLSVADNVHNYPLQLAAGIGIVGFLLLYGLFGFALWLGAPNAFSRGKGTDRLVISAFWAAALGYIVALITGLSVTGSTIFLWIALAVIVTPTATEHEFKVTSWSPAVGLATCSILLVCWSYNIVWVTADRYYLLGQFGAAMGNDPIVSLQTAISLNPWNDMYRSQLGQAYQEQMIGWMNEARTRQGNGGDTEEAMKQASLAFGLAERAYLDAIDFVPTEYDNYVFLSSLYNQTGSFLDPANYEKAIAAADRGIAVAPYAPSIRFQKAIAYWSRGMAQETADTLKPAVEMDPGYIEIRSLYAEALRAIGRPQDAVATYEAGLKILPDNASFKAALQALEASMAGVPATSTK